jgi:ATP-dependent DNA helicase RecG
VTTLRQAQESPQETIRRLREILAQALVGGDDPSKSPATLADLDSLVSHPQIVTNDKLNAFVEAMHNYDSFPGISRAVIIARGQRYLLELAMEVEDAAAKQPQRKQKNTSKNRPTPSVVYDPDLKSLAGVGPKTAMRLACRGLVSARDMLFLLPRRYDDRRTITPIGELQPGQRAVTAGQVVRTRVFGRPWKQIMEVEIEDEGVMLRGMWFSNRRPRQDRFVVGARVCLAGLVNNYKNGLQIAHPIVADENDENGQLGRIVPIYPEIPGVPGRTVEKAVYSAAERCQELIDDPLPLEILKNRGLLSLPEALELVHLPPRDIPLQELDAWVEGNSPAHQRLVYDEFFFLQLALNLRRKRHQRNPAPQVEISDGFSIELGRLLGFVPTTAQSRVVREITSDMTLAQPMQRLLQGDVGSGKTFVALAAIVAAVRSGFQAALMAPTEILAEQHMRTLYPILKKLGIKAALHIGAARSATRKKNLAAFENGTVQVVIGTHALVQESVSFRRLGLAVVDEQHRFGVAQRLGLVGKGPDGTSPHLLVMTATPIPRTLALTVHGDLDVSKIDELPPGRRPIITRLWSVEDREQALAELSEALMRGEQAYVVCPIIEESEALDVRHATGVFDEFSTRFANHKVGLLHGRLSADEKDLTMTAFSEGQIQVLVATTVIEVGVDVPNATVMFIEGAERFGLSQLHQLRGRVGRSNLKSTCHLLGNPKNEDAVSRLDVLTKTNDGFAIAQADLAIRGPGELYGKRQAGLPGFRYGNLVRDLDLLTSARSDVEDILRVDPTCTRTQTKRLQNELARRILSGDGPIGEEAG